MPIQIIERQVEASVVEQFFWHIFITEPFDLCTDGGKFLFETLVSSV